MAERKLDLRSMSLMASFEKLAGAPAMDVVEADDRMVFLVAKEKVGRVVGRGGDRLRRLRDRLGRNVDIVAFSEDPAELVANYFRAQDVENVTIEKRRDGRKVAKVKVAAKDRGRAIGRAGSNVKLATELVGRHTDISQVVVDTGRVVTGA